MKVTAAELARLRGNVTAGRSPERPAVAVAPAKARPARSKPIPPPPEAEAPEEAEEPAEEQAEPVGASASPGGAVLTVNLSEGYLRAHFAALTPKAAEAVSALLAGRLADWPELSLTANITANGTNLRAGGIPAEAGPELLASALRLLTNF